MSVKTRDFADPKKEHKQIAILEPFDDSRIWNKTWIYKCLASQDSGLSTFNFICSSYIRARVYLYPFKRTSWLPSLICLVVSVDFKHHVYLLTLLLALALNWVYFVPLKERFALALNRVYLQGTIDSGGVSAVWNVAKDGGRLDFFK